MCYTLPWDATSWSSPSLRHCQHRTAELQLLQLSWSEMTAWWSSCRQCYSCLDPPSSEQQGLSCSSRGAPDQTAGGTGELLPRGWIQHLKDWWIICICFFLIFDLTESWFNGREHVVPVLQFITDVVQRTNNERSILSLGQVSEIFSCQTLFSPSFPFLQTNSFQMSVYESHIKWL